MIIVSISGRRFWKYGFAFFTIGFLLPYYLLLALVIQPDTKSSFGDESQCKDSSSVSFCGCTDRERSFNQSVIAYSLYGGSFAAQKYLIKRYFKTFKKNIHEYIPKIYKDWRVRLYVNSTSRNDPDYQFIQDTFRSYSYVDVCNATGMLESLGFNLNVFPRLWRFLPILDPNVAVMLSRDADSLVSEREADAVNEWIKSGTSLHVMRDHGLHCISMLAGLWGANLQRSREKIAKGVTDLLNDSRYGNANDGLDQTLLSQHIWPLANNDSMSHDSYCCESYKDARPFPRQRQDMEFVGKILFQPPGRAPNLARPCPEKCRPDEHPDWTYC